MSTLMRSALIACVMLCAYNLSTAQDTPKPSIESHEQIEEHFTVYEYMDTPDYVFVKRKNFFKTLTEVQLEILGTYDYPKYVSSNDPNQIELDIKRHWEIVTKWENDNAYRIDEIKESMNLSK